MNDAFAYFLFQIIDVTDADIIGVRKVIAYTFLIAITPYCSLFFMYMRMVTPLIYILSYCLGRFLLG